MKKSNLVLATFLLSSCMMGPDYKEPSKVSELKTAKALNIKSTDIKAQKKLLDFGDKTLDNLISMAIKNNPTYQSAIISSRQARANVKIAKSTLGPSLDLTAQYDYLKNNDETKFVLTDDYYQTGLDASWEIDVWGGNRRQVEASKAEFMSTIYDMQSAYVSLVAEVASNYINYKTTLALIKATKDNIDLQLELTQLVRDKFNAGLVNDVELSQSMYLLTSTQATLSQLEYQKEMYKNSLALLTGQLPNALDDILEKDKTNLINQKHDYDIKNIYNLPASVVKNRPDVRSAEEKLKSENALIGAATANMYPNISISAVFGFEALGVGNLFNSSSQVYGYNPQLSLPIFNFGALKNKVEAQKDATLIAANSYENAIITAASEIKNAMVAINTENTKNQKLVSSYEHAKKASELNQNRYSSGLVEYSVVLESEQDKLSAMIDMINSNGELYSNLVVFYKAIGGN